MEVRDYQTNKVALITDTHFKLIFSDRLRVTEPNRQQTESPTRLHLNSDFFYSPQVMEKGLAHSYFSWVCTVPCFSISDKDECLPDFHSEPRPIVHTHSDSLSHCESITIRCLLTLCFSWGYLSADSSRANTKMGEYLPK